MKVCAYCYHKCSKKNSESCPGLEVKREDTFTWQYDVHKTALKCPFLRDALRENIYNHLIQSGAKFGNKSASIKKVGK